MELHGFLLKLGAASLSGGRVAVPPPPRLGPVTATVAWILALVALVWLIWFS